MSTRVPLRWPIPQADSVQIGRAVRSPTWLDIASATAWALGRGAQIIPETGGSDIALSAGSRYTYGFRVEPRYQAITRLWRVALVGGGTATIAAPSGGTDMGAGFSADMGLSEPVGYIEELSAQSAAVANVTLDITPGASDLKTLGISCVEIPRVNLVAAIATDMGFDITQLRGSAPIYGDSAGGVSSKGLWHVDYPLHNDAGAIGRRCGHFYWAVPYEKNGAETTAYAAGTISSSFVDILLLDAPLLQRRKYLGSAGALDADQRDLKVAALVKCSDGSTSGEVKWTATSGDTVTVNVPTSTTTWTWVEGDLAVDVEDTSKPDGLRGSAWDDVQRQFRRTAGSGTLYCAGLADREPG